MASSDPKPAPAQKQPEEAKPEEKKPTAIGEDDEFEDFPVEGTDTPSPYTAPVEKGDWEPIT